MEVSLWEGLAATGLLLLMLVPPLPLVGGVLLLIEVPPSILAGLENRSQPVPRGLFGVEPAWSLALEGLRFRV